MGTLNRAALRLVLLAALLIPASTLMGCGAVIGTVAALATKVLPIIVEAAAVLDAIDLQAKQHFKQNPNRELEEKYVKAAARARLALSAASRASEGTRELDGGDVEAAFNQYEKAFQEVVGVLGPLGVVRPSVDGNLQAGSGSGALEIPLPRALSYTAE